MHDQCTGNVQSKTVLYTIAGAGKLFSTVASWIFFTGVARFFIGSAARQDCLHVWEHVFMPLNSSVTSNG